MKAAATSGHAWVFAGNAMLMVYFSVALWRTGPGRPWFPGVATALGASTFLWAIVRIHKSHRRLLAATQHTESDADITVGSTKTDQIRRLNGAQRRQAERDQRRHTT